MIWQLLVVLVFAWAFYYIVIQPHLAKPDKKKVKKALKQPPKKKATKPKQLQRVQYVRVVIEGEEVYLPVANSPQK